MYRTDSIFEQIHLNNFKFSTLIDWSIKKLQQGFNSENLLILASLSYDMNKETIQEYFYKSLSEISVHSPDFELDKIENKVQYLINAMNKGFQSAQSTLNDLVNLCIENNYDNSLLPYYSLNDEIDLYLFENNRVFKKKTGFETLEEFIRKEIIKKFKNENNRTDK